MDLNQINYFHSQTISNQLPKFATANKLLVKDKLSIELSKYNTKKKKQKQIIELTLGDKICIVKPHTDLVCDTIVRGIIPKRHNGLESPTVFVLIADNKFDFYNIVEIANTKYQILESFRKCNSKKNIYNLSIGRLYPQMIKAITKIKDSIILVFSPIKLPGLINYK